MSLSNSLSRYVYIILSFLLRNHLGDLRSEFYFMITSSISINCGSSFLLRNHLGDLRSEFYFMITSSISINCGSGLYGRV
jgi:hypothetical protein